MKLVETINCKKPNIQQIDVTVQVGNNKFSNEKLKSLWISLDFLSAAVFCALP